MKRFFLLSVLLLFLVQVSVKAQSTRVRPDAALPVVSEHEIFSIEAGSGIDLLLVQGQDYFDGLVAKVSEENLSLLKVKLATGRLKLSLDPEKASNKRVLIYVHLNDSQLTDLRLTGDAYATTRGILDINNLTVKLTDKAKVALRSTGKIRMEMPDHFERKVEERAYTVIASGK